MNAKHLIAVSLLLVALTAHGAEAPADGLYESARGAPAPQIQTQDGRALFLGAKRALKLSVQGNRITANDNANTTFWLHVRFPNDGTAGLDAYVLLIGGTAYRQRGYGISGDGTASMSFEISGDESARQVARYFNVPVTYFRHPGYQLRTSFSPTRQSIARSEKVTAIVRITNIGTETIAFMNDPCEGYGANRGARYRFSAYRGGRSVPDIGDPSEAHPCATTVSLPNVILKPGETFENTINLSRWFDFKEPGFYQIHGSCRLAFLEPNERSMIFIWSDYVAADFAVTID